MAFILYLIECSICLAVFLGSYRALLRNGEHFFMNRLFLLGSLMASLIIPALSFELFSGFDQLGIGVFSRRMDQLTVSLGADLDAKTSLNWANLLLVVYYTGFIASLILFFYELQAILMLKARGIQKKNYFELEKGDRAFSFFQWIFIPESTDGKAKALILRHERFHAIWWHSLDNLFIRVTSCLMWFNPMTYWLLREIRMQHEFHVDSLCTSEFNRYEYARTLLVKASSADLGIIHFYNQQFLKKRLTMLSNNRSQTPQRWKHFLFVPVFTLLLLLFACHQTPTDDVVSDLKAKSSEIATIQVDEVAEFPGGQEKMLEFVGSEIGYPEKAKKNKVEGLVIVSFLVGADGIISNPKIKRDIGYGCGEEAIRMIEKMPKWNPARKNGKAVAMEFTLPVKFALE